MKKVLIGLAAGALAVTAMTAPVNAAPTDSVYVNIDSFATTGMLLIDAAGLADALDTCGNGEANYTVFFPAADAIFTAVLTALDLSLGELLAQPALVKAALLNHVVKSDVSEVQFDDPANKTFTSMGGLLLVKTSSVTASNNGTVAAGEHFINGIAVNNGVLDSCNGTVYTILGFLAPNSASPTLGLTSDGSATQAAADGEGLPATGSESLALTYAALASLIAGAGVLVIRRRSVA